MHRDLRDLIDTADWFATVVLPAPSRHDDAGHRFQVEWANARKALSDRWSGEQLATLDDLVGGLPHDGGAAVVVIQGLDADGSGAPSLVEFLDEPVHHPLVAEGHLPRLATLIEGRQRAIAHVVVETDRAGADITAFDGGDVLSSEQVQGETLHIHRGHPGGWSQRRFQQRAENTWEQNARDVADTTARLAHDVDAQLIAVAGDVRAQTFVLDALPVDLADRSVKIEAGSADGIADEVVKLLATQTATRATELSRSLREGRANGRASVDAGEVMDALEAGRVETLVVHDDGGDLPVVDESRSDGEPSTRLVDAAIAAALRTDAEIFVVPDVAVLDGPVGALLRW